jgi:sec-independent protein translocase protein TatA
MEVTAVGNIGFREILIVLLIVLILFGSRRIPEVMKAFGKGIREFKKAAKELESPDEDEQLAKKDDKPSSPAG